MAAVAPTDLFSARAIFPKSIFFWASPLSLRISVAVHGRSPVEFFVIHVSLNIPPHGGGYLVHVLRSFHARRNHATRLGKSRALSARLGSLWRAQPEKCEFAAPGQSCIRAGYGAFPPTQTIRLGAFGGVGAIHFGRRRDVAGHCNDLIPCRARIYYDWRGARPIFRTSRCGQAVVV